MDALHHLFLVFYSLSLQFTHSNSSIITSTISCHSLISSHFRIYYSLFNPFWPPVPLSLFRPPHLCVYERQRWWFDINSWVNIGITLETVERRPYWHVLPIWALNPCALWEIWVLLSLPRFKKKSPCHTAAETLWSPHPAHCHSTIQLSNPQMNLKNPETIFSGWQGMCELRVHVLSQANLVNWHLNSFLRRSCLSHMVLSVLYHFADSNICITCPKYPNQFLNYTVFMHFSQFCCFYSHHPFREWVMSLLLSF